MMGATEMEVDGAGAVGVMDGAEEDMAVVAVGLEEDEAGEGGRISYLLLNLFLWTGTLLGNRLLTALMNSIILHSDGVVIWACGRALTRSRGRSDATV